MVSKVNWKGDDCTEGVEPDSDKWGSRKRMALETSENVNDTCMIGRLVHYPKRVSPRRLVRTPTLRP